MNYNRTSAIRFSVKVSLLTVVAFSLTLFAQQKGQWVPGQTGLNGGVLPQPGFTYLNNTINYSADTLQDSKGNTVPGLSGNYSFFAIENTISYVPDFKVLGGHLAFTALLPVADGSVVGDLGIVPQFPVNAGNYGFADIWIQPVTLGWHFNRMDTYVGYAFVAPTGRYNAGASDNVGSGYWGNNFTTGTTVYLTKNRATSANLVTNWEFHGSKKVASLPQGQFSEITPGQAFTIEWGLGQVVPLKKDMTRLLQLGVIGYDQWQVSDNGGNYLVANTPVPAKLTPYYSVHAIGLQTNFMLPAKNLAFFFKYIPEYLAIAHPQGRTFSFGMAWTLRYTKPLPRP